MRRSTATGTFSEYGRFPSDGIQTTYSWRSAVTDEEQLAQDVKEFTTTTRNGFALDSSFDNGHVFWSSRQEASFSHPHAEWEGRKTGSYSGQAWKGPLVPDFGTASANNANRRFPTISRLTTGQIGNLGGEAIKRTVPTAPSANLSQMIAELKERAPSGIVAGLGSFYYGRQWKELPAKAGSDYLNYEFALKPLWNDVISLIKSLKSTSAQVRQFQRDSGKVVRRSFEFQPETSFTSRLVPSKALLVSLGGSTGTGMADATYRSGYVEVQDESRTRTWFSGAYQYYLGDDKSLMGRLERYEQLGNKLLGTRFNASLLYELTAWSWLADWVFDLGDALRTAEILQSDGLVVRYGYLMRHTVVRRVLRAPSVLFYSGQNFGPVTLQLSSELKEREKATPYGFSLGVGDFTSRQWAILAALGFTRAPQLLR